MIVQGSGSGILMHLAIGIGGAVVSPFPIRRARTAEGRHAGTENAYANTHDSQDTWLKETIP